MGKVFEKFWEKYNCEANTGLPMFDEEDRILAEDVFEIVIENEAEKNKLLYQELLEKRQQVEDLKMSLKSVIDSKRDLGDNVDVVLEAIESDEDYRQGWLANIAMAFQDQHTLVQHQFYDSHMLEDLHTMSNRAALQFLRNLTGNQKLTSPFLKEKQEKPIQDISRISNLEYRMNMLETRLNETTDDVVKTIDNISNYLKFNPNPKNES